MRTIVIMRGLPGSGKSTRAAEMVAAEPGRWIRINRDDLRAMVRGPGNNPHEKDDRREDLMRRAKDSLTRSALKAGYDVILDDTHLKADTVKQLHRLAEDVGDVLVIERPVTATVEECIRRDSHRNGFRYVGEAVIRSMAKKFPQGVPELERHSYYPPRAATVPVEPTPGLPECIICDLDGTLAKMGDRSPYDASRCDELDSVNEPVACVLKLAADQCIRIFFMSARSDKDRAPTARFIARAVGWEPSPARLIMRKEGDSRKDSVVKEELYREHVAGRYNVLFVLDDRNQVVDMWRELGLTCFQVAPGDF